MMASLEMPYFTRCALKRELKACERCFRCTYEDIRHRNDDDCEILSECVQCGKMPLLTEIRQNKQAGRKRLHGSSAHGFTDDRKQRLLAGLRSGFSEVQGP